MVTDRKLTETEKAQGFTSVVFVRQAGRTPAFGVEIVDPETGRRISGISRIELERRQRGQRKFKGELFVTVPARPEVEVSIRRREEKQEAVKLVGKRLDIARREGEKFADFKTRVLEESASDVGVKRLPGEPIPSFQRRVEKARKPKAVKLVEVKEPDTFKRLDIARQEEEAEKVIRGRFTEKAFRELIIPLGAEGVIEEGVEPSKAKIKTLLIAEPERPELFKDVKEVRFIEREQVFKPGPPLEIGFKPVAQQLIEKKLVAGGVEVPEKLTTLQQLKIGAKELPFQIGETFREPSRLGKGLVKIPITLGKDIITIAKGPAPFTPQFGIEVATDKKLRESAIRVATTGAIIGGLTLLPATATIIAVTGFTGLKIVETIKQPSPEAFGELAFVGAISALAIKAALPKKGGLTIIKAPVKDPIALSLGKRHVLLTRDISSILGRGQPPPPPSTVPSLRLFDLTKVIKGTGAEVLGAKVTLGTGVSSQILVGKPEVVTGIKTPTFKTPSFIKNLIQKIPKKVSVEIIEDGKAISFKEAIKRPFIKVGKPISFDVNKIVGEQLVTDDLILDGKRVTRQRVIEELEPTTIGKLFGEQLKVKAPKPKITITIDFAYQEMTNIYAPNYTYEDSKGMLTRDTRTKLAWLQEKHGIEVLLS